MVVLNFVVLVCGRPAANFPAVLIDDPHSLRGYLPERALDINLLRMWMISVIKAANASVG
jgi:hypothetical protein